KVSIGVDSVDVARIVSVAASEIEEVVPVRIEIDTGLRRTGVEPDSALELVEKVKALPFLTFEGLYTHEGQLASLTGSRTDLKRQGHVASRILVQTAELLRSAGHDVDVVSVGSTPGWDSAPFEPGVTEARAG